MTTRRQLGLVAGAATLMAATPIVLIYDSLTWLFQAIVTVGLITGAAAGVRYLRGRLLSQIAAMVGGLFIALTLLHGNGTALAGIIPTPKTLANFEKLFTQAGEQVASTYVPTPDLKGLLFVTSLGIGVVAILVDVFAVGLRRPALAGLPMLAIYSVPVAVYVDSVTPIPFVIGAVGFLWLLVSDNVDRVRRFGRRFTGEGRGVDIWEPSPLAAAGRRLAVAGVLVAVVLPIAAPGMTGLFDQLANGPGSGPGGRGGGRGPGSVDLVAELSGMLNQEQQENLVLVVNSDPTPGYMRFGIADEATDKGFRNRQPNGSAVSSQLPAAEGLGTGTKFRAQVEVTGAFDMPMVPTYPITTGVIGLNTNWKYDKDLQIIYSERDRSPKQKYQFDYVPSTFTPEQLRAASPITAAHPASTFTKVPTVPAVSRLVTDLTKGKVTNYDKVRAIFDFFSEKNGFVYDQRTKIGSTGAAITDFLDEDTGRQGFCEQYATAMAWMVRVAGIPSRVAVGFTRGNLSGGVYTMTNRNLHAWTEVYFQGFGWVPFDATPSAYITGAMGATAWAPNPNAPEVTPGPVGPSLTPGPISTVDPEQNRGDECLDGRANCDPNDPFGDTATPAMPMWTWWAMAGGVVVIILLITPALVRVALRRRRSTTPEPAKASIQDVSGDGPKLTVIADTASTAARAHAAWEELLDTMVDFRIELDSAETPRATAARLAATQMLPTITAEQAKLLGYAEERARYAPTPHPAEGLAEALKGVRKQLAAQANRRTRWMATIMPPSVTQRWRAAITARTARMSARNDQFRYTLRRAIPRLRRS